jgi:hypothetical protein
MYDPLLLRIESDGTLRVEPKQILCASCGKAGGWPRAINQREFAKLKADPDALVRHVVGEIKRHRQADDGTMLRPPHARPVVPLVRANGTDVDAADLTPLFRRWARVYAMRERRKQDKAAFRAVRQRLEANQYSSTPFWQAWAVILDVLALGAPTWDPGALALVGRLCGVSRAFRTHVTQALLPVPLYTLVATFGVKTRRHGGRRGAGWRGAIGVAVRLLGRGRLRLTHRDFTTGSWDNWLAKTVDLVASAAGTPAAAALGVDMDLVTLTKGSRRSALSPGGCDRVGRLLGAAARRLPLTLRLDGVRTGSADANVLVDRRHDTVVLGALVVNGLLRSLATLATGAERVVVSNDVSADDEEAVATWELGIWCALRYGASLHMEADHRPERVHALDLPLAPLDPPPVLVFQRRYVADGTVRACVLVDGPDPTHPGRLWLPANEVV